MSIVKPLGNEFSKPAELKPSKYTLSGNNSRVRYYKNTANTPIKLSKERVVGILQEEISYINSTSKIAGIEEAATRIVNLINKR